MLFAIEIRIVATTVPVVALFCTVLRLYYRWSRQHLGLDDAWAAFSLLCAVFMVAGAWVRSDEPGVGPFHQSARVRVIGYYMVSNAFTCVLWSARMSILFSIIRLIPYIMRLRRIAYGCAVLFFLLWIGMLTEKAYVCGHNDPAWKTATHIQCVLGHAVGITEITFDFVADAVLVLLPLRLLWGIRLRRNQIRLLVVIFSASVVTFIVSVIHARFVFSKNRNGEGLWAHLEASTALVVCNFAVLVSWARRSWFQGEEMDSTPPGSSMFSSGRRENSEGTQLSALRFSGKDTTVVLTRMEQTETDTAKPDNNSHFTLPLDGGHDKKGESLVERETRDDVV